MADIGHAGVAPSAGPTEPSSSDRLGTSTTPSRTGSANLADVQDSEPVATCAILLPKAYSIKEGTPLWGGVKLGRLLGAGVQAKVFELSYNDDRPTGKVLKISHTDLGHKLINNPMIWIGMEREWEIGTQLRAALEEPGGQLPGFMRMCDCLVRSGDDSTGGSGRAAFSGMIMEKLNGWEVYKRIDTPEFHNIHYVREMLFQVFSALDRAQRKLGFHHADLGMRNIMEHYPRLWEEVWGSLAAKSRATGSGVAGGGGAAAVCAGRWAEGYEVAPGALPGEATRQAGGSPAAVVAEPGAGTSLRPGDRCFTCEQQQQQQQQRLRQVVSVDRVEIGGNEEEYVPPERRQQPWWRQSTRRSNGACGMARPRRGFSCNADGSRLPLGPNLEFKVIDFGVATFDALLAQAAGGYESEEVMQRLNTIFAAKNIAFGSHKQSIEMATADSKKKTWHLLPTGIKNRFQVKQTLAGTAPIRSAESLEAAGRPRPVGESAPSGAGQLAAVPEGGAGTDEDRPQRFRSATLLRRPGEGMAMAAEMMRQSQGAGPAAPSNQLEGHGSNMVHSNPQRAASKPAQFKQSPIEKVYRRFWQRKGDVFHLLLNMALVLDDRVWPKEDERDVQLFISMVHHVTGVRMRASFAVEGEGGSSSLFGRLACGAALHVKEDHHSSGSELREYGRWGKWHHWFRRMHIRWSAHMKPFNSGLLAGEALVSPFFGAGRVQHAKLPVCVEQAFPRSST